MHQNNGTLVRYLAVMMVVAQHAFMLTGRPDPLGRLEAWWIGHFGVLMFFALSGYLLCSRARDDSVRNFALRRVLRIYPLLLTVNLLVIIVGIFVTTLPFNEYFAQGALRYWYKNLFHHGEHTLPGVRFAAVSLTADAQVNASLWSIYYELRSYVLIGLLGFFGILANRALFALLVLIVILLEPSKTWLHLTDPRAYSVTLAFLIGALFANQGWRLKLWHVVAALALAILAHRLRHSWPISSVVMIFCVTTATVTLAFGNVPYFRIADRLPDLSYGIFLLHWPALLATTLVWPTSTAAAALSALFISIVISIPLHFWVEEPARRWRFRPLTRSAVASPSKTSV